ncbi:MAG TPA: DUF3179 domain-containing (seleno)protein [Thermoanaerobaculia bacterium]|jgi:hypothetical protein|nr:DUF3179 domain-containing (seleno)protein [Thermoanaerobaculia bacterium]
MPGRVRGLAKLGFCLGASLAFAAAGCFGHQYRSGPRVAVVGGDPIVQMKPAAAFPIVTKPSLVAARIHSDPPDEESRILGLTVGSVPRGYPIGLLDRFEVVNDSVPDLPFVVARCALTAITAVFDSRVGGRVLHFENSGALWRDTLVLRDLETGTYWSAATGAALHGPLSGQRLRAIPAVVTRAREWERAWPGTLYLDLGEDTSEPILMRVYRASSWQGVSGKKTSDTRHKPKQQVFALRSGDEALVFTAKEIEAAGRLDASVGGDLFAVTWDPDLRAPRAYAGDGVERPLIPMFWFAANLHFARVRTILSDATNPPARGGG